MNDGRTCNNYCNFFFSCFSVTSNKLYFAWVYSNIYSMKKILIKQKHIMVRLSLANCLTFHFFSHCTKRWWGDGHLREATRSYNTSTKDYRWSKDKIELYQGIDLTRNKILINVINDVVAGRFSTKEQQHDLHARELSSWKTQNTNFSC